MSIEFRCTQCDKLLRTSDDTAGKQAKCPECGTLMTVPAANLSATLPGNQGKPVGAASPFGSSDQPSGPPSDENPYQSPAQYGPLPGAGQPDAMAAQKVSAPATALMIAGGLGVAMQLLSSAGNLLGVGAGAFQQRQAMGMLLTGGANVAMSLIGIVVGGLVVYGAVKMKNLENHGLSMAAAIIAMIPCISPCCVLGLPFGIWAIVVLSDPSVKAAFRS